MQPVADLHTQIAGPATAFEGRIKVSNVSKSYGVEGFTKTVVRNCTFTIEPGELTVMIGPSGCGKTTLTKLLAGFEHPNSGSITIDGKPVDRSWGRSDGGVSGDRPVPVDVDLRQHHVRPPRARRGYSGDAELR